MPYVNNLNFPENVLVLSFLHTVQDNFGKQIQHKMEEPSISLNKCFWIRKKIVSGPSRITVNYIRFALVSMETEIL